MSSHRTPLPTLLVALAALLLGSLFPIAGVLGQGTPPPAAPRADAVSASAASPVAAGAVVGAAFTYQGNLHKEGEPVDDTCSFEFRLWDALEEGTQVAETQTIEEIQVQAGVFTVGLDFGDPFSGQALWLETSVQCAGDGGYVTLAPRQPLNAVPYALSLKPGASVEQPAANRTAIYGKGTGSGSVGLYGESATYTGLYGKGYNGVTGVSSETGWAATYGEHQGAGGYGVYGRAPNGYGTTGESVSSVGVYGKSTTSYGVLGESTGEVGVVGKSQNANGMWGESANGEGVRGTAHNAGHAGVVGYNDGGSYGVYGESTSSSGVVGVSGAQFSSGVYGENKGSGGYGVFGKAANGSGVVGASTTWAGVYGETATAGAAGVWAKNTAGGVALKAEGSAVQDANKGGFVKAMAYVNAQGQILRCYNGVTGASAGNCGFSAAQDAPGGFSSYRVDFGFNVSSRFVSITQVQPYGDDDYWEHWAYIKTLAGNAVILESGFRQTADCRGEWRGDSGPFCAVGGADFMIFVY